jgi:hypothetical protein
MSEEVTREFCMRLAVDMVAKLRASNEDWADFHGVPDPFQSDDYAQAAEDVFDALFTRTRWGKE